MSKVQIDPRTLSQSDFKQQLRAHLEALPLSDSVNDFYQGSSGELILNLIAGVASFQSVQNLLNIHETTIDFAKHLSSVIENGFDRGLLLPPTKAPEVQMVIHATSGQVGITKGELLATINQYEVYSLETKVIGSEPTTLKAVVGNKITKTFDVASLSPYTAFLVDTESDMVAEQLESVTTDSGSLTIRHAFNEATERWDNFILRRIRQGEVRFYVGNGKLGWLDKDATFIKYEALTYNNDVNDSLSGSLSFFSSVLKATDFEVLVKGQFFPDKEEIRGISRLYPLDGRVVQDSDYEGAILTHFSQAVIDVYSFNSDPDQEVYIIWEEGFENDSHLEEIRSRIDKRRGLGIPVNYHTVNKDDGLSMSFKAKPQTALTGTDLQLVQDFVKSLSFKFSREPKELTSVAICSELTLLLGKSIVPVDFVQLNMESSDFLTSLNIDLTA